MSHFIFNTKKVYLNVMNEAIVQKMIDLDIVLKLQRTKLL